METLQYAYRQSNEDKDIGGEGEGEGVGEEKRVKGKEKRVKGKEKRVKGEGEGGGESARRKTMANDLLTTFNTASRAYGHVVFNEKTQEFERAGKRHAIATFFGLPDARAKNNLTLQKIKEALCFEASAGGRLSGCVEITDGLFRNVDGNKRIKSSTVNEIIKAFRNEVGSGVDKASAQLADQLKSEKEYMIVIDSPRFSEVAFYSKSGQGSAGRAVEVEKQCKDIKEILELYCGEGNGEQVSTAMYEMAQAAKRVLLPYTIQNALDNLPRSFCPVYTIKMQESGDLVLNISNTQESDIALDLAITIHPDGTHSASDPVILSLAQK